MRHMLPLLLTGVFFQLLEHTVTIANRPQHVHAVAAIGGTLLTAEKRALRGAADAAAAGRTHVTFVHNLNEGTRWRCGF